MDESCSLYETKNVQDTFIEGVFSGSFLCKGDDELSPHFFSTTIFFLVVCPYDENQVKVTDKECLCSEQDSLKCQQGETCVKPRPSDTGGGIKDGGVSGSIAECKVACLNPAWDVTNNIESPGSGDQEYLMGEHTFTCTDNHYVMTQKVFWGQIYHRTYNETVFSPMNKA